MLGDATIYKIGEANAYFKIEQGWKQKVYVDHLFELFGDWVFRSEPYARPDTGARKGLVKSYSFKTMASEATNPLYSLFIHNGVKTITPGLIKDNLTARG